MKPFKTQAHIHSLDGQMDEITILKKSAVTAIWWIIAG